MRILRNLTLLALLAATPVVADDIRLPTFFTNQLTTQASTNIPIRKGDVMWTLLRNYGITDQKMRQAIDIVVDAQQARWRVDERPNHFWDANNFYRLQQDSIYYDSTQFLRGHVDNIPADLLRANTPVTVGDTLYFDYKTVAELELLGLDRDKLPTYDMSTHAYPIIIDQAAFETWAGEVTDAVNELSRTTAAQGKDIEGLKKKQHTHERKHTLLDDLLVTGTAFTTFDYMSGKEADRIGNTTTIGRAGVAFGGRIVAGIDLGNVHPYADVSMDRRWSYLGKIGPQGKFHGHQDHVTFTYGVAVPINEVTARVYGSFDDLSGAFPSVYPGIERTETQESNAGGFGAGVWIPLSECVSLDADVQHMTADNIYDATGALEPTTNEERWTRIRLSIGSPTFVVTPAIGIGTTHARTGSPEHPDLYAFSIEGKWQPWKLPVFFGGTYAYDVASYKGASLDSRKDNTFMLTTGLNFGSHLNPHYVLGGGR